MQTRHSVYTLELRDKSNNTIKLICGDPWSFQDTQSAAELFAARLSTLLNREIASCLMRSYMSKGILVTNKDSLYIKFSWIPDKVDLSEYEILY